MNGEEVWVRMMAAVLSGGHDVTTDTFAQWADEAVAEWRKRYGKPAEPEAPAFKVGDRVCMLQPGWKVEDVEADLGTILIKRTSARRRLEPHQIVLDPKPPQR